MTIDTPVFVSYISRLSRTYVPMFSLINTAPNEYRNPKRPLNIGYTPVLHRKPLLYCHATHHAMLTLASISSRCTFLNPTLSISVTDSRFPVRTSCPNFQSISLRLHYTVRALQESDLPRTNVQISSKTNARKVISVDVTELHMKTRLIE